MSDWKAMLEGESEETLEEVARWIERRLPRKATQIEFDASVAIGCMERLRTGAARLVSARWESTSSLDLTDSAGAVWRVFVDGGSFDYFDTLFYNGHEIDMYPNQFDHESLHDRAWAVAIQSLSNAGWESMMCFRTLARVRDDLWPAWVPDPNVLCDPEQADAVAAEAERLQEEDRERR